MSDTAAVTTCHLPGPAGRITVHLQGDAGAQAVVMTHSILSSSMMWDALAPDPAAVMATLAIDRAHYVGLSLGGMSGFALARRDPQRLLSLVLCDCRADAPPAAAPPRDER